MSESNAPPTDHQEPLLLPPPSSLDPSIPQLVVNSEQSLKLDALGPMVVNSDGTLSRIANWEEMTEAEQANIVRVLSKRNRERIQAKLEEDAKAGVDGAKS